MQKSRQKLWFHCKSLTTPKRPSKAALLSTSLAAGAPLTLFCWNERGHPIFHLIWQTNIFKVLAATVLMYMKQYMFSKQAWTLCACNLSSTYQKQKEQGLHVKECQNQICWPSMLTHTRNLVPAVGVPLVLYAIYRQCTYYLQTIHSIQYTQYTSNKPTI